MTAPNYTGLCLGGPHKGQMMTASTPTYPVEQIVLGLHKHYYYVPLFGHQGYWLWEDETKGTMPYDDIMRILVANYIDRHKQ